MSDGAFPGWYHPWPMTAARLIDEAEGLAFLGLYEDAWGVLDNLLLPDQVKPAVRAVRVMICQGWKRWELGTELARQIGPTEELQHREAVGRFHLAHALAQCAAGDLMRARTAVWAMALVWPEGRELARDSQALAAMW